MTRLRLLLAVSLLAVASVAALAAGPHGTIANGHGQSTHMADNTYPPVPVLPSP